MGEEKQKCCQCGCGGKDEFLEKLFKEYQPIKDNLIQILNEVQEHYGYVPMHAQKAISEFLNVPMAEIYGVVTFYSRFTLKPKGKYKIEETKSVGACGLAPVFTVNGEVYGKATVQKMDQVLDELSSKEE